MLAAGKNDLRKLPLRERKQVLRDSFDNSAGLVYVIGIVTAGEWVFEEVKLHDLEGMAFLIHFDSI